MLCHPCSANRTLHLIQPHFLHPHPNKSLVSKTPSNLPPTPHHTPSPTNTTHQTPTPHTPWSKIPIMPTAPTPYTRTPHSNSRQPLTRATATPPAARPHRPNTRFRYANLPRPALNTPPPLSISRLPRHKWMMLSHPRRASSGISR